MRVLHVLPSRAPEYGGPVAVAEALVQELLQQGVEAMIYPPLPGKGEKISFTQIPMLVRQSNLVHIHGLWNLSATVAAVAARVAGIPYIVTPHGMLDRWSLQKSSMKKKIYGFLFERKNLLAAASLDFLNSEEQDEAKDYGIPFNSFVLPNGVFAEKYAIIPDRIIYSQNYIDLKDKVLALFLGRLHPKKGFDILLPALARAIETVPNLHLLIAGPDEGGYKAVLLDMVNQYSLKEHVTFLGMVQEDAKKEVLAAADFFVLSSHQEGDSIAIKEAMASGLPVAITPACHFPEVMTLNAGVVVKPDLGDWAKALINLAEHKNERTQMGKNAAKLIMEQYTWQRITERLKLIYKEVSKTL
jgi:glycosyltransferase involved in cell wall biosynthesis